MERRQELNCHLSMHKRKTMKKPTNWIHAPQTHALTLNVLYNSSFCLQIQSIQCRSHYYCYHNVCVQHAAYGPSQCWDGKPDNVEYGDGWRPSENAPTLLDAPVFVSFIKEPMKTSQSVLQQKTGNHKWHINENGVLVKKKNKKLSLDS